MRHDDMYNIHSTFILAKLFFYFCQDKRHRLFGFPTNGLTLGFLINILQLKKKNLKYHSLENNSNSTALLNT